MKKVVGFLTANPVQYLATVGRDGKAKCRPFMFCFDVRRHGKIRNYDSIATGYNPRESGVGTISCR